MALSFDPISAAEDNWIAAGWGAPGEMAVATSITRAHQILLARINEALAPHGLTFSRFEALALLRFSRRGALPLSKMGERLQVHPTSITNTIDRLEADGLVERRPHPSDRRTTLAAITDRGRNLVESAAASMAEARFGCGDLDEDTTRRLRHDLGVIRRDAGDF